MKIDCVHSGRTSQDSATSGCDLRLCVMPFRDKVSKGSPLEHCQDVGGVYYVVSRLLELQPTWSGPVFQDAELFWAVDALK